MILIIVSLISIFYCLSGTAYIDIYMGGTGALYNIYQLPPLVSWKQKRVLRVVVTYSHYRHESTNGGKTFSSHTICEKGPSLQRNFYPFYVGILLTQYKILFHLPSLQANIYIYMERMGVWAHTIIYNIYRHIYGGVGALYILHIQIYMQAQVLYIYHIYRYIYSSVGALYILDIYMGVQALYNI